MIKQTNVHPAVSFFASVLTNSAIRDAIRGSMNESRRFSARNLPRLRPRRIIETDLAIHPRNDATSPPRRATTAAVVALVLVIAGLPVAARLAGASILPPSTPKNPAGPLRIDQGESAPPSDPRPRRTPALLEDAENTDETDTSGAFSTAAGDDDPLSALQPLIDEYLKRRDEAFEVLAKGYRGALRSRIDEAADAGNLKRVQAYRAELSALDEVEKELADPTTKNFAALSGEVSLPELSEDTFDDLASLRATWDEEWQRRQEELDRELLASVRELEVDLTRQRKFDQAARILSWREDADSSLGPETDTPSPAPTEIGSVADDEPFVNGLGMQFVPVPGTDVLVCTHETRWKDFKHFAESKPSEVAAYWREQTVDGHELEERPQDHPVVGVSWPEATAFCEWLSGEEGLTYRLPTDREWSIAVGLGSEERWRSATTPATVEIVRDLYPWGDEWPPPEEAGNYNDESRRAGGGGRAGKNSNSLIEGYDDGYPTTSPVRSFEPNRYGLYDLGGNAWEWVADRFDEDDERRVLRGASWSAKDSVLFSSYRFPASPDGRGGNSFGFRVVLEPEE